MKSKTFLISALLFAICFVTIQACTKEVDQTVENYEVNSINPIAKGDTFCVFNIDEPPTTFDDAPSWFQDGAIVCIAGCVRGTKCERTLKDTLVFKGDTIGVAKLRRSSAHCKKCSQAGHEVTTI